jgi:hypothetical protein
MTESPADDSSWPSAYSLGSQARSLLFKAVVAMPDVFILAAVMLAIVVTGELALGGTFHIAAIDALRARSDTPAALLLRVSKISLGLLDESVVAIVAVAVHRFILLDQRSSGPALLVHDYMWKFVLWTFALASLSLPSLLLVSLPEPVDAIFELALAVLGIRLMLLFPGVAIDAPAASLKDRIVSSWRRTRGIVWKLFFALVIAILPLVLGGALAFVLRDAVKLIVNFGVVVDLAPIRIALRLFNASVLIIVQVLGVGVVAAVASRAWQIAMRHEELAPDAHITF